MLTFIFAYILISLISLFTGYFIDFNLQTLLYRDRKYSYKPFIFYVLTGLITATVLGEWIALFLPCNFWFTLALASILLILFIGRRSIYQPFLHYCFISLKGCSPFSIFFLMAIGLLIITINAGPTLMDDTESYHIQMVKWIQEYGSPKGIANLHSRYGFNSAWFTSIALFSIPSTVFNTYTLLNGVLVFWFCSYLANSFLTTTHNKWNKDLRFAAVPCFIILCISLLLWPIIRGSAGTSNYDSITMVIVFVLFASLISNKKLSKDFHLQWILFPLFLLTVRVINYPFLLITAFIVLRTLKNKEYNVLYFILLSGVIIITPFLFRNVLLSGYILFPSLAFNFFDVDWKVERQVSVDLMHFIKYFNRVNDMYLPISQTASYKFPEWIPYWYKYLFNYDKILVDLSAVSLLLTTFFYKKAREIAPEVKVYILAVLLSLISWFFIAPDPRFVYGNLLCLTFFFLILIPKADNNWHIPALKIFILTLGTICFCFTLIKMTGDSNYRNWFTPLTLKQPEVKTVVQENIRYYIPEKLDDNWNKRCYGTSLPCLYELNPKVIPRGTGIRDGFKMKQAEDK